MRAAVVIAMLVLLAPGVQALSEGDVAPGFAAPGLMESRVQTSDSLFAASDVTLLVFWNTECPDCLTDFVRLGRVMVAWSRSGNDRPAAPATITLCTDDDRLADARRLAARVPMPGTALRDPDRLIAGRYGVAGESFAAFLIDRDRRVRLVQIDHPPSVDGFVDAVRSAVAGMPSDADARVEPDAEAGGPAISSRITIRASVDTRWLLVDVHGRAPSGVYGEALEPGKTFLRRLRLDVEGRVSETVTAGGRLRLSNEPDEVLRFGPEYYARAEGSAFVGLRRPHLRVRVGYFTTHFTPLSYMRWDEADLGLGGAQRGCAVCGGATAGVLVESLEEVDPDLTMEGALAAGDVGDALDWTLIYARPREARLVIDPIFVVPELTSFQYHQDLYGARVTLSRFHAPTAGFAHVGLTAVHVRDDPRNPRCPGDADEPLCQEPVFEAARSTALGADARILIGRRVVLEGEWLRLASREDVRRDEVPTRWASGYRATAGLDLVPGHLKIGSAWLRLEEHFTSPYGALTYVGNRHGQRHRIGAEAGPAALTLFLRSLTPIEREWVIGNKVMLDRETTVSAALSARVGGSWTIGLGYQRDIEDVSFDAEYGPEGAPGIGRIEDEIRDIVQMDVQGELQGLDLSFTHQWIDEDGIRRGDGDSGTATVTSVTASADF